MMKSNPLESVQKVSDEDFQSVNPRAIWEAEKRLFFLPDASRDLKVEAANYLVRNRLDYSLPYIHEGCLPYSTEKYTGDHIKIPYSYNRQWFEDWVEEVNVFWNRIEYRLTDPTDLKHQIFRMFCTSPKAFSKSSYYRYDGEGSFPPELIGIINDIPAEQHDYNPDSKVGVVYLHKDGGELHSVSVSNKHELTIVSPLVEGEDMQFMLEKPVGPDAVLKIGFLNGYKISESVLEFILRESSHLVIYIEKDGDPYSRVPKERKRNGSSNPYSKLCFLSNVKQKLSQIDEQDSIFVFRRLSYNSWFKAVLGV